VPEKIKSDKIGRMQGDIERVLISQEQIKTRVQELANLITRDHLPIRGSLEVTIVPIMTGAMIFCGDLIRKLPLKMQIGLITVSSYPGASMRSKGSEILGAQLGDISGRHILLVDDILDSGGTINLVVPILRELGAASVKSCVLLRKDRPESKGVHCDYVGFQIPDVFVVGYGLDYNNYYRNLADIVTLKPGVYGEAV
jgi:hypoxanthine phosphoribosyltransferase